MIGRCHFCGKRAVVEHFPALSPKAQVCAPCRKALKEGGKV